MSYKLRPYRGQEGVWEVDIMLMLPTGEVVRERKKAPVTGKDNAGRWARAREQRILIHGGIKKRKEVPTFEDFCKRYQRDYVQANRQKPSTVRMKTVIIDAHLLPRFGKLRLDEITEPRVQELKAALADRKTKTTNNVLQVLGSILRVAVEWDELAKAPKIKPLKNAPPVNAFFDFSDYESLVDAAGKVGLRAQITVLLGGDAGLRCGEILALEQSDIDHKRGFLNIRRSEWEGHVTLPKSGKGRRVPMTKRLAALLSGNRHLKGTRVLFADGNEPLSARYLRTWMRQAERRANLPEAGKLHTLRHTFCSHLAMRGATLLDIKELAGHSDVTITQRYMHLSPQSVDRAIRLLDEGRDGEMMEKQTAASATNRN